MTDVLTPQQRSATMAAVRGKNTSCEIAVRRLLRSLGFRYGLHKSSLPGKPDIVLSSRRTVIFVHGCFWHLHTCRQGKNAPTTNVDYWTSKRLRNAARDRRTRLTLRAGGWRVLTVWECWLRRPQFLMDKLRTFLRANDARTADARALGSKTTIANAAELRRTQEQLANLEEALSGLRIRVARENPERFRLMAASYIAEIEMLRKRVDDYIGVKAAREAGSASRRTLTRKSPRRKHGKNTSGRARN